MARKYDCMRTAGGEEADWWAWPADEEDGEGDDDDEDNEEGANTFDVWYIKVLSVKCDERYPIRRLPEGTPPLNPPIT